MVPSRKQKKEKSLISLSWKWKGTAQGESALTQLLFLVHELERKRREPRQLVRDEETVSIFERVYQIPSGSGKVIQRDDKSGRSFPRD